MKTAEEILQTELDKEGIIYECDEHEDYIGDQDYAFSQALSAMHEYAEQFKPQWITSDEFQPISGKHYFSLIKAINGNFIKCVSVYTEGWDLEVDCDGDEDYFNHDEKNQVSYMPKGWYESCEQNGGSYDEMYFKRDVIFILDIELP